MEQEVLFPSIERFLDLAEEIQYIYGEYKRLKQENEELRKENKKRFNDIMEMANRSQKGVDDFVNAVLSGKISLDGKKHKDCGVRVKGTQRSLID